VPLDRSFDALIGLEYQEVRSEAARASLEIRPELLSPQGHVGSGVLAAAAEGLASMATALDVVPRGRIAAGLANDTSILAPVSSGRVEFRATRVSGGESEWVWRVEAVSEDRGPCALSIVTVAVRDA
jgi:uncharacterized protein (TIGR00369 family)